MSCRDRCLKELSTLMLTVDKFKVTKNKETRQSRKCCFKRQTGRVTKGPTRHRFFFFYSLVTAQEFYLANKESCNLQVWGQADSNGEAQGSWLPLFVPFCLLPSEPALYKFGLAREGARFFTSHHSF